METKSKLSTKLLAILLAAVLVITSIPIAAFTVFAADELAFVITETKDETSKPISNATIKILSTKIDGNDVNIVDESSDTETTNSQGKASFSKLNEHFDANPNDVIEVKLEITATDYQKTETTLNVKADSTEDDLTVNVKSNPMVSLSVTGRDKELNLYKDSFSSVNKIESGTKVEVGTKIIVADENFDNTNYKLNETPQCEETSAVDDIHMYSYTVGTDDLSIVFAYTAITYTVKATVTGDEKHGKINDITDNGSITINKTESETIVTLTPDTGYHLNTLKYGETGNLSDVTDQVSNNCFTIDNSSIDGDDKYEVEAEFEKNIYAVTLNYNNAQGTVACTNADINLSAVPYDTDLTFDFSPNNRYGVTNILVNGEAILDENVRQNGEFTVNIKSATTINVTFGEIDYTTLSGKSIEDVYNITYNNNNHYVTDNTYYLKNGTTITIAPKNNIALSDTDRLSVNGMDIFSSHYTTRKGSHWLKEYENKNSNDDISPLQVTYTYWGNTKTYAVDGTVKVRIDSESPEITLPADRGFTKDTFSVSFTVTDPSETYNTEYSSGINDDSVKVTRNYGTVTNEAVIISGTGANRSFDFVPVEGYTGDIVYTITAKDNVNNTTTKTYTVKNDKVAPTLIDGTNAIDFKIKNDNVFARVINSISFGKWLNKKIKVTVNATDSGVGFGGSATANVKFISNGQTNAYSASINSDGVAKIDVDNGDVFYGTIEYQLSDSFGNTTDYALVTKANSNIGNTDSGIVMIEEEKPSIPVIDFNDDYKALETTKIYQNGTNYPIVNGNPIIDIDFEDTDSGLYSIEIAINSKTPQVVINNLSNNIDESASKTLVAKTLKEYTYTLDLSNYTPTDDGEYVISAKATDNSGNVSDIASNTYIIDKTNPEIVDFDFSVKDNGSGDGYDGYKEADGKAVEATDYGFYFKKPVTVTITAKDEKADNETASGVKSITYYKIDVDTGKTEEITRDVNESNTISFDIEENFKGQIYAKATDFVENTPDSFVHPDGSILEDSTKHNNTSAITFTSVPTAQGTQNTSSEYKYSGPAANTDAEMDYEKNVGDKNVPLYNKDIEFGVTVTDTYSGIREITYTIIEGKEETVKTVKLDNTGKIDGEANGWSITNTDSNLATEMTNTIAVSGNYNDMVLLVELTDRAGNTSYDYYVFGIDKTAPTISVRYDNNKGDSQSGTGTYFDNHRKATVVITERNFNKENVKWTIKNDEGNAPSVKYLGSTNGSGNKDNATHTFEINYNYDGVFSFDVSYTDRATNKNTDVDYGNSLAPKSFVVDTVNPTITVSYNNNSAQNEKYFKEYRTATITIVEHNFDVNRVKFTMTAALSGTAKAIPAISWNHSGDTHIATINYNSDGDYTFDVTMEDKSGRKEETVNYGNSVAAKDFVIDTTYTDIVKVDGVANGDIFGLRNDGSINDAAEIKITFNDVNFDKYSIHLYRNRVLVDGISENANSGDEYEEKDVITTANKNAVENDADVTEEFIGSVANGSSNTTVTFDIPAVDENKIKNDGMYTLRIEANDKAGNTYDTNSNVITFAVNRYGSVYTVDDDLYNLINDNEGYTQAIAGDIVIREYNTTDVTTNKLSILRGATPLEGVECEPVAVSQTGVEWHEYAYKVDKSYFMDGDKYVDGEYSLIISSTDKADIKSTNDKYTTCQVGFVLDTTAPKINGITPSAESKNISLDNYLEIASDENVTFTVPVTDNLRLSTVEIFIGDTSDDATPAYVYTYKGDKVEVNTDKGGTFNEQTRFDDCSFTLSPGTSKQNFRVKVTDKVGLTVDTADFESGKVAPEFEGFFNEVLITSNWFVRMWNRPVFKIALGSGLLAAIAASAFIIIAKKRKKDDEEQPQAAE